MLASFYKKHKILVWALIALTPLVILILGCILAPEIFWDRFLYKYFWGPVVSDLEGRPVEGISEGYNIVSTILYALLLALALLAMYKAFKRLKIGMDLGLIVSSIPMFLFGGVSRALEDAALFQGWLGYWFISPLIYLLIGLLFVSAGIFGHLPKRRGGGPREQLLYFTALVTIILIVYYAAEYAWGGDLAYHLTPAVPLISAFGVVMMFYMLVTRGYDSLRVSIFCTGLLALLISVAYAVSFAFSSEWQSVFASVEGYFPTLRPMEAVIIPGIALALSAIIWIVGRASPRRLGVLALPTSFLMFLAHFLDGTATYRGIDLYGYGEKHVLPTALIELTGSAVVMLLLKFLLVLAIILLVDVLFKEELERYPSLGNIMKFAVVFLGMAPGARDVVRIALGV